MASAMAATGKRGSTRRSLPLPWPRDLLLFFCGLFLRSNIDSYTRGQICGREGLTGTVSTFSSCEVRTNLRRAKSSVAFPSGDTQGALLEPLLQEITLQLDAGKAGADLYRGLSSTDAEAFSTCRLAMTFSRWAIIFRSSGRREAADSSVVTPG